MEIYDISMTIENQMKVYKNIDENRPNLEAVKNIENHHSNESRLTINLHTGTHIDAPIHMLEKGKSIEEMDIEPLITKCKVIDLTSVTKSIGKEILKQVNIEKGEFVLFKTTNSIQTEFNPEFVYLDKSGAKFLKKIGVKGIGTDGLGIERNQPKHETHKILLENNIYILEGLVLNLVEEGEYTLIALPLKIKGADASPVRAILVKELNV